MAVIQTAQSMFFNVHDPMNKTHKQKIQIENPNLSAKQPLLQIHAKTRESDATQLFDKIPQRSTFAWNSLIRTRLNAGDSTLALEIFRQMLLQGAHPDKFTFPFVLTASGSSGSLLLGKQLHGYALKLGFIADKFVGTALMTLYGNLEGVESAHKVFDKLTERNLVSWTLLIGLYLQERNPELAIKVFDEMLISGVEIDSVAVATAIGACGRLKSLREGKKIHEYAKENGFGSDILVGNSLLKMYLNFGRVDEARTVFDQMPSKDLISWTAIIGGLVQNGSFNEGLKLFRKLQLEDIRADPLSISSVLPACARISARKNGKEIHGYSIRNKIDKNLVVQNSLMDMYVKSGNLESASKIFAKMEERDEVSWTVMILGYSLHGRGKVGVELFKEMEETAKIQPDQIAYAAALHACNTATMVREGRFYFDFIRDPKVEHFALMVGLLARANLFDEAKKFIDEHGIEGFAEVQRALLHGCRIYKNTKLGTRIVQKLIEIESLNAENYVLLSNLYAEVGKWERVEETREMIEDMGLAPRKPYSWIEVRNKVHVFGVGDSSHPRSRSIHSELQLLEDIATQNGFMFDNDFALHDVDDERECVPRRHSERLAVAFGLISLAPRMTIHITKNLRVCRNCHTSMKIISKIVEREIVLKDPDRFHHFKDGSCSCRDLW